MIVDRIENAHLYTGLPGKIANALQIPRDNKLAEKENGRYNVDGDNLYYLVQRYETKPTEQGKLEAHKKYTDIQFVAAGEELLGFAPLENLETKTPYDEAGDYTFYKVPERITNVNLQTGMFCVLFPQDGHMPGCQLNGPSNVVKVVVKLKTNAE